MHGLQTVGQKLIIEWQYLVIQVARRGLVALDEAGLKRAPNVLWSAENECCISSG